MNCSPGDLAILKTGGIAGGEPFADKLVEVIHFDSVDNYFGVLWCVKGAGWTPDADLVKLSSRGTFSYPDSLMRPIRDQPGEDEMLRIAGRPTETVFEFI